jgi:DNA-binding CsgD family transcriptional regulator
VRSYVLKRAVQEIVLGPGTWVIGRDASCHVRVADKTVSRRHATIRVDQLGVRIEDLKSANGVRVNGVRVRGTKVLDPGDRLSVGLVEFELLERPASRSSHTPTYGLLDASALADAQGPASEPGETDLRQLSLREQQVLRLLAQGYTRAQVAEQLGVRVKTVETYRARLTTKLGIRSRADLTRFAREVGLLDPAK